MKPKEFCALRKSIGVSAPVLAAKVNTSAQCVHYFETGKIKNPRWPVQRAIKWMQEVANRRDAA